MEFEELVSVELLHFLLSVLLQFVGWASGLALLLTVLGRRTVESMHG